MPKRLADKLHDEIDGLEESNNRAVEIVAEAVKGKFAAALEEAGTIQGALEILAAIVGDELADLTTDQFKASVEGAKKRFD